MNLNHVPRPISRYRYTKAVLGDSTVPLNVSLSVVDVLTTEIAIGFEAQWSPENLGDCIAGRQSGAQIFRVQKSLGSSKAMSIVN